VRRRGHSTAFRYSTSGNRVMRRILITFILLIATALVVVGGVLGGVEWADARWTSDMERLGSAMRRLDQDIKAGGAASRDADYFLKLSDLPLERFDDKSVTYYAGPYARHSVTIEFDESGVKGLSVR
jgi:hypothetical protein